MSELTKTIVFVALAAGLATTAYLTRPQVNRATSSFVEDRAPFYPDVNPDGVKGLEVTAYDKEKGELDSFSVKLQNGIWVIPSHNNYPADAAERLKKTAGAVLALQKDTVASDGKDLHKEYGLVDPTDASGNAESWGTRVKLLDVNGNVVSDLLIGKDVPDKTDFKFVRIPDKDRVYQVKCAGLDLTTRFADWIDTDLVTDSAFDFDKLVINDYKLERVGNRVRINDKGVVALAKDDKSKWKLDGLAEGEETDETKAGDLATAVSDLKILGVRPKPAGLTKDLNILEQQFVAESMISRGFFPTEDGRVVSNEGEVSCETKDGIRYTLRFGGVFLGRGGERDLEAGKEGEKVVDADAPKEPAAEGAKPAEDPATKTQENRFLLISVAFNEARFPEPEIPASMKESAPAPPAAPAEGATPVPPPPAETAPPAEKPAEPPAAAEPPAGTAPEKPAEPIKNVAYQEPAGQPAPPAADPAAPSEAPAAKEADAPKPTEPSPAAEPAAPSEAPAPADAEAQKKLEEEMKARVEVQKKIDAEREKAEYDQKKKERDRKIEEGRKKAKELEDRYGQWFYVVSNESALKVRLTRADLIKKPEPKKEGEAAPAVPGGIPSPAPSAGPAGESAPPAEAPQP